MPTVDIPITPVVVEKPVVPTTFHSDRNDQRLASRTPASHTPRNKPFQPARQSGSNGAGSYKQAPKKPRSSAQNEDDLIRMLNSQD